MHKKPQKHLFKRLIYNNNYVLFKEKLIFPFEVIFIWYFPHLRFLSIRFVFKGNK